LLRDSNRAVVEANGQVIFLESEIQTLIARLTQDENKRPLLAGDLEDTLTSLIESRRDHYGAFKLRVSTADTPENITWKIQQALGHYCVRGMGPEYDVLAQTGGLDSLGQLLQERGLTGPVVVVTDTNVAPLYADRAVAALKAAGCPAQTLVIKAGESYKTLETVSGLWNGFLQAGLDRKSTVVALGGGVVGDLAGFAAATYMRGCQWITVPTTLLAMVDASMGGKTGFDLPEGKNLIGAFYPPRLVLADPNVLATLPERELRAGLAEVVKHGIIADPELFELCEKGYEFVRADLPQVVRRAMGVKIRVIEQDPFEMGFRAALNLGHTIGHAVELASRFTLLHGEAVAIGTVAEARLAEKMKIAESSQGLSRRIAATLSGLGLPTEIPPTLSVPLILQAMRVDKKKDRQFIRFALPIKIGEVKVGVAVKDLESVLG
jgi:shikimate kinase / 3-dehydroquinate synthase